MSGFKDVKEMNQSVNNYQMGGSAKLMTTGTVSCAEDDVLADILGQMDHNCTKSVHKPNISLLRSKENKAMAMQNSHEIKQEDKMEVESLCESETQDDNVLGEILSELNSSWGQKQTSKSHKHTTRRTDSSRRSEGEAGMDTFVHGKCEEDVAMKEPSSVEEHMESDTPLTDFAKVSTSVNADGDSAAADYPLSIDTGSVEQKGKQGTCSFKQAANKSREHTAKCDVTGKHEVPPKKMNADSVEDRLAGSFGQLSPFKRKPSQQSTQKQNLSGVKFTDRWNRFAVHGVSFDRKSHEVTLELSAEGSPEVIGRAILRDSWSDTHIEAGDIVHFLPEGGLSQDDIIIDDSRGHLVVNPDLLLSGTTIVSGVYCLRRSVLNEKFKGVDSKNVHMLYGSIIHSLFQEVLKDRLIKTDEIMRIAKSIVQSNKFLHEMYGQSAIEAKVMEEIQVYMSPLQDWFHKHVPPRNGPKTDKCWELSVVQIHDIEETIWSPRLGVKGKIDMTVEVQIQKDRGQVQRKVVPLELKTGKASYSVEHKGQVTLYSLMMSERRENPEEGLLLYLKHNDMNFVPVKPENTRGLLQLRNEMAYYLNRQTQKATGEDGQVSYQLGRLPPPINSHRSCSKCPQLINCAVYQRSVENLKHSADHAMTSLVPATLAHLSDSHLRYFTHWLLCMDLESTSQRTEGLRNIWCMASCQREERGECLQQMVMVDSVLGVPETQAFTEGKGCCVQFHRKPGFEGSALNQVGLSKNDSVVISTEDGKYIALSTGFIKDVTESVVDVVVDRDSFHENATFQSLVFRIDRCDNFNTAGYLLTNLSRLMEPTPHSQRLRSLIIDGRKPAFQLTLSKGAVEKVKRIFKPLNKPQKTAILKVLMSRDFVLIKGYPGTGKTSTIVALVKILRELGQSVLLTSYTHSAVDNILLKLKKDGVPFLRLGRSSRIHPDIQDHAAETLTLDITSVDALRDFYASYGIVATSCLGINHPLFSQRKFDVCIVDEASQVLQPACLGPLFCAQRFVLVGDPKQLPPVVQSKEASSLGMGESLFARLDGAGATYDLNLQYRMNSTIMQLSNELVYNGALRCGSDQVSHACIQPVDTSRADCVEWLDRALDTQLTNAVVFLDTCKISAPESSDGRGLTNNTEASLILALCHAFVQVGISAEDMGVIAPYRAQVKLLQQRLSEFFPLKGVEVNTVDQYQGRDKSVIFISFVRSASSSSSDSVSRGGLLQDVRRLNVAVTRAKHKLVLVGNSGTLSQYQPVNMLLSNLRARKQIYVLPTDLQLSQGMDV